MNYGDYIAWDKFDGKGYCISVVNKQNADNMLYIDNNPYPIGFIQGMINADNAKFFSNEDIKFNTDNIKEVNKLLLRTNDSGEVYGIWLNLTVKRIPNFLEQAIDNADYCDEMDEYLSNLANIRSGWDSIKDVKNNKFVKMFNTMWKHHLGIK